jgi:hypothetical protein
MAQLVDYEYIRIKNYTDLALIDMNKSVFSEVSHIYPKNDSVLQTLFDKLKVAKNLTAYFKAAVPEEFHYRNNRRIGK